jgi:peptidylprolyl isomerase
MKRLLLTAALILIAGCKNEIAGPQHVTCDPFLQTYGVAVGDTIDGAQGLRYIEIATGAGDAASSGRTVDVNYSGYLLNGNRFDTSCPPTRTALRVALGDGKVVPGFELGLNGMRPGGLRRIIVPPDLGYGDSPNGPIPGGSTLVFDLQLVQYVGR